MLRPSEGEVLSAVQASGYLMEQEVASAIEGLGFNVQTNRAFTDLEQDKSREIDVWAIRRFHQDEVNKISVFVELLCECKNNANPFVFLLRPKGAIDERTESQEWQFPISRYQVPIPETANAYKSVTAAEHLRLREHHYRFQSPLKAVQFAKILREKNSWVATHAGLYDAIFFPLVKALLARREEVRPKSGDWRYVWLFFPLVVTSGELYVIDTSASAMQARPVESVSFTRHIKNSKIDGHFSVDFVTQSTLDSFWSKCCQPFVAHVVDLVATKPELFKKRS